MAISQRMLFITAMLVPVVFLILIFLIPIPPLGKFICALLALFTDLIAFSTKYYTYIFMPFIHMKNRTIILSSDEAFVMAPSGNAIIVRNEDGIFASAFVRIPSYRSATEMSPEEKVSFSRLFSRAVTLTKTPVKFASQLYVINKDEYIGNIRGKLNEAEERYQNLAVNQEVQKSDSERVKGEVTMWHNLYDNVSKTKSQALEAYAMVTAQGGNDEEASNLALQQADEIATGLSAVFGIGASVVEGEELLKFVEPDHMIPSVTISEQIMESSLGTGT